MSAEGGRFRVNVYRKDTGVGAAFRAIPSDIPRWCSWAAADRHQAVRHHQGMILVTGSTGTGKSTTLAAMIDLLNPSRTLNIISLEDPIEFVHRSKSSQIIQRELGTHIPSFAEGVRAAMREDPDVILVGELRDAETIRMAMTAAETGHLVLGTLHTTSAVKTIDRMIDALPAEEREQTKSFLSQSLLAVVTQILVKTADGRGRKAIVEVMVTTKAIGKLISTDQTHQIPSQLQTGQEFGMQMFDQALLQALTAREIDPEDAFIYAADKRLFEKFVTDTGVVSRSGCDRRAPRTSRLETTDSRRSIRCLKKSSGVGARTCTSWPATRPRIRLNGELSPLRAEATERGTGETTLYEIMPRKADRALRDQGRRRFCLHSGRQGPFSCQCLRHINGMGAVFRAIPSQALTLDQLDMPRAVRSCAARSAA